ncbi:hypothetical protein RsS62_23830 [Rhizobium dioscoreae]|nr:hypothetical protein RsS62_23830 [Rhizobium dioscoreae]
MRKNKVINHSVWEAGGAGKECAAHAFAVLIQTGQTGAGPCIRVPWPFGVLIVSQVPAGTNFHELR